MASIFKRTHTDKKTGRKRKSRCWYVKYRDSDGVWRRTRGYTDKEATRQLAARLERNEERKASGLSDPCEEHRKRPISEHLDDFRRHLIAKGNTDDHVNRTLNRVKPIVADCRIKQLADLKAGPVADCLHQRREKGLGIKTANYYLTAIKGFCRWLVKDGRLADNPLTHLSRLNADTDVRVRRRVLSVEEFERLVQTTRTSDKSFRGLTGPDRAILYCMAAYTGFRASELASLTPTSLELDGTPPTATTEASYSKRRRRDIQPLPSWLAGELKAWIAEPPTSTISMPGRPSDSVQKGSSEEQVARNLWPGTWNERAAQMLRRDLNAAGIPYEDDSGVVDFHALRHLFISRLAASGVHPKVAQQLARHSTITLTMDRYTHANLLDIAGAVESMPGIGNPESASRVAATGTDGPDEKERHHIWHQTVDVSRPQLDTPGTQGNKTPSDDQPKKGDQNAAKPAPCPPLTSHDANRPGGIRTPDQGIMSPLL